ncbi:hypothetical protein PBV87_10485 [Niameybacter massiliensis]|uniref:Uncharacterized protein n=1 Tax=Holtiella tumoricola TaxID=3018743 RepID=A0AA42DMV6_9FIRM|nr:hypothetical protein [Holtiella tumoricola]MDA3731905.1 hypothetical protein [Holtiella tumoricola]
MKKLEVKFENCYGIRNLEYTFDYERNNGYLIYAPNGTMKTSFAKSLLDIANQVMPEDKIYAERESKYSIKTAQGNLDPQGILVIESYNENLSTEKASRLLADKKLKEKYDKLHNIINEQNKNLLRELKILSGIRNEDSIEKEIKSVFNEDKEVIEIFEQMVQNIEFEKVTVYEDIKYTDIFNAKTEVILNDTEFKQAIEEYMKKYNQLLEESMVFKRGLFNHNNASSIEKSLKDNNFFRANFTLIIEGINITNEKELQQLLEDEKKKILTDEELLNKFNNIDKILNKNAEAKKLRTILEEHNEIIECLIDVAGFKKSLWLSYLAKLEDILKELMELYIRSKDELKTITEIAKQQQNAWYKVVDIFNKRFDVPFIISIENQEDVILKEDRAVFSFKYKDGQEERSVDKNKLLSVLSNGEKRALYILNVIFEIEARKEEGRDIWLIIDDIADSFDYKNKYAIVEYLKDILELDRFRMLIMTHNFDFYRTVGGRLNIARNHCLMSCKTNGTIELKRGEYLKNIFSIWKDKLHTNQKILIASIPFVRNIIEYIEEEGAEDYITLTSLLHIKDISQNVTIKDLEAIYNRVWKTPKNIPNKERSVLSVIDEQAEIIYKSPVEEINLENKIVLSIAIRLESEKYMIKRINDINKVRSIKSNQTQELFKIFKEKYKEEDEILKILEQVNLMTPENIHMNSFMYEPLLDMDGKHLNSLYIKLKELYAEIVLNETDEKEN